MDLDGVHLDSKISTHVQDSELVDAGMSVEKKVDMKDCGTEESSRKSFQSVASHVEPEDKEKKEKVDQLECVLTNIQSPSIRKSVEAQDDEMVINGDSKMDDSDTQSQGALFVQPSEAEQSQLLPQKPTHLESASFESYTEKENGLSDEGVVSGMRNIGLSVTKESSAQSASNELSGEDAVGDRESAAASPHKLVVYILMDSSNETAQLAKELSTHASNSNSPSLDFNALRDIPPGEIADVYIHTLPLTQFPKGEEMIEGETWKQQMFSYEEFAATTVEESASNVCLCFVGHSSKSFSGVWLLSSIIESAIAKYGAKLSIIMFGGCNVVRHRDGTAMAAAQLCSHVLICGFEKQCTADQIASPFQTIISAFINWQHDNTRQAARLALTAACNVQPKCFACFNYLDSTSDTYKGLSSLNILALHGERDNPAQYLRDCHNLALYTRYHLWSSGLTNNAKDLIIDHAAALKSTDTCSWSGVLDQSCAHIRASEVHKAYCDALMSKNLIVQHCISGRVPAPGYETALTARIQRQLYVASKKGDLAGYRMWCIAFLLYNPNTYLHHGELEYQVQPSCWSLLACTPPTNFNGQVLNIPLWRYSYPDSRGKMTLVDPEGKFNATKDFDVKFVVLGLFTTPTKPDWCKLQVTWNKLNHILFMCNSAIEPPNTRKVTNADPMQGHHVINKGVLDFHIDVCARLNKKDAFLDLNAQHLPGSICDFKGRIEKCCVPFNREALSGTTIDENAEAFGYYHKAIVLAIVNAIRQERDNDSLNLLRDACSLMTEDVFVDKLAKMKYLESFVVPEGKDKAQISRNKKKQEDLRGEESKCIDSYIVKVSNLFKYETVLNLCNDLTKGALQLQQERVDAEKLKGISPSIAECGPEESAQKVAIAPETGNKI